MMTSKQKDSLVGLSLLIGSLCKQGDETVYHLLLHPDFAMALWYGVSSSGITMGYTQEGG